MTPFKTVTEFLFNGDGRPKVVVQVVTLSAFWFFAGWSLGLAPAFGQGFARAEGLSAVQAIMLEDAIMDRRIRYCSAPDGSEMKVFFAKSVNEKLAEYFSLTGINYNIPTCPELVYVAS